MFVYDFVTPRFFSLIKRLICLLYDIINILLGIAVCHTKCHCYFQHPVLINRFHRFYVFRDPFDKALNILYFFTGQDEKEFLAAPPGRIPVLPDPFL